MKLFASLVGILVVSPFSAAAESIDLIEVRHDNLVSVTETVEDGCVTAGTLTTAESWIDVRWSDGSAPRDVAVRYRSTRYDTQGGPELCAYLKSQVREAMFPDRADLHAIARNYVTAGRSRCESAYALFHPTGEERRTADGKTASVATVKFFKRAVACP